MTHDIFRQVKLPGGCTIKCFVYDDAPDDFMAVAGKFNAHVQSGGRAVVISGEKYQTILRESQRWPEPLVEVAR